MAKFIRIIRKISNLPEIAKLAGVSYENLQEGISNEDFTNEFKEIKKNNPDFIGKFESVNTVLYDAKKDGMEVFQIWIFS